MALRVSVEFRNCSVQLDNILLKFRGEIVNQSGENWVSENGWAAGYHLFDEPAGTLVVDGERTPIDLSAGRGRELAIDISLPPEPGEYNIYVSMMREHVAWFYERGWPFLLVDVRVNGDGRATLLSFRVTNIRSVLRKRLFRSLVRVLTLPVGSVWRNRRLIRTLVRRDVLSRYRGSFAGAFWAILNPLLLMLTYFFVFGVILNARFAGDSSRASFALYFLAGMLPWLAFSEAAGRAPFIMIEHRAFIKKLVFPVETLPVNLVVSGLVTEFFGAMLFILALLIIRGRVPLTATYLPLLVIPQVLFTAGIAWFLAALGVFVRDLTQINGFVMTIWFFITPICYPETALMVLPRQAAGLLAKNPVYILVRAYRSILLESHPPDWGALAWLVAVSFAVFICGHAWFYKLRKSFADLI